MALGAEVARGTRVVELVAVAVHEDGTGKPAPTQRAEGEGLNPAGLRQYTGATMKIILLGNAGSGKSTLAKRLTDGQAVERLSLDQLAFADGLHQGGVLSCGKHFPGHGSSKADSHKGFTDVTNTWSDKELEPFMQMIEAQKVDMIMTAHIFNRNLDEKYPATLSKEVNTRLLRNQMHYEGVIITDDLQMAAIHKHYTLEDTVTLALNSGVDILLFANQLAEPLGLDAIVKVVKAQVRAGKISEERIEEAYRRVKRLKERL